MAIFLNAGLLKSTTYTIGDYKIEWRKNSTLGEVAFISGKGNDPIIQAQHPLVNEVVTSGQLYPVIVYVYINGVYVTSSYEIGEVFSPDLVGCLDFVLIDEINCSTMHNADPLYNFVLNYNNTTDITQNKSRIFTYRFGPTTQYVAWRFYADNIADAIKLYYCTEINPDGVLLDYFATGIYSSNNVMLVDNALPTSYPENPKVLSYHNFLKYKSLKYLTDLTGFTYNTGDYLRIEIIGSVYDSTNNNTNWSLSLKCLESFNATTFQGLDIGKINLAVTPTIEFNESNCVYAVRYKLLEAAQNLGQVSSNDILKYLTVISENSSPQLGGSYSDDMLLDNGEIYIPYSLNWNPTLISWNGLCENLQVGELINVVSSNGNLFLEFTNIDTYNRFVNEISIVQSSTQFSAALASTVTEKEYYTGYYVMLDKANSCGDAKDYYNYHIHFTSIITYDSANKTINFTKPTITNQFLGPASCSSPYSAIAQYVSDINYMSIYEVSYFTNIITGYPVSLNYINSQPNIQNMVELKRLYNIPAIVYDSILSPSNLMAMNFCLEGNFWTRYKQHDRITFTEPSTHETRMANWTIERQIKLRTGICSDTNYELVYESTP